MNFLFPNKTFDGISVYFVLSLQVATVEATRGEVTASAMKLEEELEHTKRVQGETTERLVSRSADVESVTRSLVSTRGTLHTIIMFFRFMRAILRYFALNSRVVTNKALKIKDKNLTMIMFTSQPLH